MSLVRRLLRASLLATFTFGLIVFVPVFFMRGSAEAAMLGIGLPAISALLLLAAFGWVVGVHVFAFALLRGR